MIVPVSQNDPEVVRRDYADESAFAVRAALWAGRSGPDPVEVVFEQVRDAAPRRVLEVGCGRGDLAERLVRELGAEVVTIDQSERMVELAQGRGIDARVGDAQSLPFADGAFDCAVAAFMLYHVADLDRALGELARVLRPGGRLVAATNGYDQLHELWQLVGRDLDDRRDVFMRENGGASLRRFFPRVRMIGLDGTLELTADEMREYVACSVAHSHLAARVPEFEGTRTVRTSSAVFVARKGAR